MRHAVALVAVLALSAIGCAASGGHISRPEVSSRRSASASPEQASPVQAAPGPRLGRGAPPPAAAWPTVPPPVSDALVRTTAGAGRKVALTFDDGPSAEWTPQVLALLDKYGAKATFCVVGRQARAHPELLRRIVAKGHRLCNHSENHPQGFRSLSEAQLRKEITGARDAILAALPGVEVPWFRAPGGSWSPLVRGTAASYGMKPLAWTVDTRDWERGGVDRIVATVKRELRPGGVVLMHDAGGERSQTVAALRKLLPWLVGRGYRFDFPG